MERDEVGEDTRRAVWGSSARGRHSFQLRVLLRRINVRFGVVRRAGHSLFVPSRSWRRPRPRQCPTTSPGAAGCCTRCSATRSARSGWTRTRSARATCPRAGRRRRRRTPRSTRGAVGGPALIAAMLTACKLRRPAAGTEVRGVLRVHVLRDDAPGGGLRLTLAGCHLPETGWGHLTFADSTPAAGRAFTDDGRVHEDRGLKGRDRARRAHRRPGPAAHPPRPHPARAGRHPPRAHRPGSAPGATGGCSAARAAGRSRRPPIRGSGRRPGRCP